MIGHWEKKEKHARIIYSNPARQRRWRRGTHTTGKFKSLSCRGEGNLEDRDTQLRSDRGDQEQARGRKDQSAEKEEENSTRDSSEHGSEGTTG